MKTPHRQISKNPNSIDKAKTQENDVS